MTVSTVITIKKTKDVYTLNIKPEVCAADEIGVTIILTEKEYKTIKSLDFDLE